MSLKYCVIAENPVQKIISSAVADYAFDAVEVALENNPDVILCLDRNELSAGFVDLCKQHDFNCIGVTKNFLRLETSRFCAKMFAANNGILCPRLLPIECPDYPQVVKLDERLDNSVKVVLNDAEKKSFTTENAGHKYFVEEFLDGEIFSPILFRYRGKLIPFENYSDLFDNFTPQKSEKFKLLLQKLESAFVAENAEFSAIFALNLIWKNNEWYLIYFIFTFSAEELDKFIKVCGKEFFKLVFYGNRYVTEEQY